MTDLRKHVPILSAAALLLFCALSGAIAQESTKPITEKGLVSALTIGGLATQELVDIIDRRGVDFPLTPEVEQQLRAAGATSEVIEAVRTHYHPSSAEDSGEIPSAVPPRSSDVPASSPSHSPSGASPSMPADPGVFYREGANWTQLRPESAIWHHEGLMHDLSKGSGGLLHGEITGEIAGTHSPITMHSPASFLIHTTKGAMLQDYLLVHLHEKHDNRDFKVSLGGANSRDAVDFRAAKIADQVYEIDFTQGTGDYAFFTRSVIPADKNSPDDGQVLTFRIIE
jgi:hypothetical protein